MEKTIDVNGQPVRFKSTGRTPRRYRAQFGKDFFADIAKLAPLQGAFEAQQKKGKSDFNDFTVKQLNALNFEVFENILWAMAATADESIPDVDSWLDSFEDGFPVFDIIGEVQDLMSASFASVNSKKNHPARKGRR